eukprot:scaffold96954_cov58-Phaeocystis_antarctica.AAC.1
MPGDAFAVGPQEVQEAVQEAVQEEVQEIPQLLPRGCCALVHRRCDLSNCRGCRLHLSAHRWRGCLRGIAGPLGLREQVPFRNHARCTAPPA